MPALPALKSLRPALTRAARCLPMRRLGQGRLELLPAVLMRGRGLSTQRALATAAWLLRDAATGAFLAKVDSKARLQLLQRVPATHPLYQRPTGAGLPALWRELGIRRSDAAAGGLRLCAEPAELWLTGRDRYGRPLWLAPQAARAWRCMQAAAGRDGIPLQAISGFRSVAYQSEIIRRKRSRGLSVEVILAVNAAPGYSEHHSGRALDIGCPGEPPAEESFEHTAAFAWLQANARRFGFRLSYPRDNPHGIVYEPWHWCWHPPAVGARALPR